MKKLFVLLTAISGIWMVDASASTNSQYLTKPTGNFKVSVVQHSLVNTTICPDYFYQESHAWFYSNITNSGHCHQLNLAIYYPTNSRSTDYISYYRNDISQIKLDIKNQIIESNNVAYANKYIKQESLLKSYVLTSGKIVNQKFPLIIFSPGMGVNSNSYQNFITNLVSHGYIVATIDSAYNQQLFDATNNQFLNTSPTSFESGISTIWQSKSNLDLATSDFNFVLAALEVNSIHDPVSKHIDFDKIGGLGHSLGARVIYNQARNHNTQLKAAAALEIGRDKTLLQNKTVPIPFMFMNAANLATSDMAYFNAKSNFELTTNNFLVKMTPNESDTTYSAHMTFSDYSTLRYARKLNELYNLSYNQKFNESDFNQWYGTANGYSFTDNVNSYLVSFFDYYLKNKPVKTFTECEPLDKSSLIYCGTNSNINKTTLTKK